MTAPAAPGPSAASEQPSLWRSGSFWWFWSGQTVSQFGTRFSGFALPVIAVVLLHATALEVGLLGAAQTAAFLLVGLPAGALIDRMRKRRVMIVADLVRLVTLAVLPVTFALHALALWQVIVVAVVIGVGTVFFDVSYQSIIPFVVPAARISGANARLEASTQLAGIASPGIAGLLLAVIAAPLLLLADAASYLVSAATLLFVRDTERPTAPGDAHPSLLHDIGEGAAFVWRHPLLRRITATTAGLNLFETVASTLLPVVVLRQLGVSTALFGAIESVAAVGGLLGAVLTPAVSRWIGQGTSITVTAVASGVVGFATPLAALVPRELALPVAVPVLMAGQFVLSFAVLVYNINQLTMRQRLCPPRLLGRMNASIRTVVWGVLPIGGLASGLLGTVLGVQPTLWIGAVGALLAAGFVTFSPLTGMRVLPTELDETA